MAQALGLGHSLSYTCKYVETRRDSEFARVPPSSPENPLGYIPGLSTILEVGEIQPGHFEFPRNLGRAVALATQSRKVQLAAS